MKAYIKEIEILNNDDERIATLVAEDYSFRIELERTVLTPDEVDYIAKVHRLAYEKYMEDFKID